MKLYKQINNLKIYNYTNGGWCVKTPKGIILEIFAQRHSAEAFCRNTLDFINNK